MVDKSYLFDCNVWRGNIACTINKHDDICNKSREVSKKVDDC